MEARPKNVLVAVDGSKHSFEAVRYVAHLLPPGGTRVTLFHVMDRIPDSFWDLEQDPGLRYKVLDVHSWEFQKKKNIEGFMKRADRLLRNAEHPKDCLKSIIHDRRKGIARDIIEKAQEDFDALVVGRLGLSPLKDLILGSIANKLVGRLVDMPVWVVGGRPPPDKLLVAVDRSEEAKRTLDYVEGFLSLDGMNKEVLLLHVIRGKSAFLPEYESASVQGEVREGQGGVQEVFREVETEMEAFLSDTIQTWGRKGIDTSRIASKIIWGTSRAGGIVDHAKNEGFGTLIVGRKGISRVEEFFMGRVSNKVLQLAKKMAVWVVN